jgi:threonine aldolase
VSDAVDLRSDTVTRPTPGMRRAIAEAVVGDDVFGDDPTVQELERRVAREAGKQAALYVPSGTMGNQLAIRVLTERGDQVLVEAESHIFLYEQGGISANSGCMPLTVHADRGVLTPEAIAGGAIVPLERLRATAATARAHGLCVHLDGARLWNASVATGIPIAEWAAPADTVMMCFSKGLGAPVGSILAGPAPLIAAARRVRKLWGGGMRQVGILAAACLYALDHHVARLADDHRRARVLAAGIAETPGVIVPKPDTNLVYIRLEHAALDPAAFLAGLESRGVRMSQYGPQLLRAATHLDVDDRGIVRAVHAFQRVAKELSGAAHRPAGRESPPPASAAAR